jgi:hypothetical protein
MNLMRSTTSRFYAIWLSIFLLVTGSIAGCTSNTIRSLDVEGVETFRVGGYPITIETQSFSIAGGDNGPANVLISGSGNQTIIHTRFDVDLFQNIKPAYVSWQNVDGHRGRDLLIWTPTYKELVAEYYVSNGDGKLYPLSMPQTQPLP